MSPVENVGIGLLDLAVMAEVGCDAKSCSTLSTREPARAGEEKKAALTERRIGLRQRADANIV
jgi:hypothetical protein